MAQAPIMKVPAEKQEALENLLNGWTHHSSEAAKHQTEEKRLRAEIITLLYGEDPQLAEGSGNKVDVGHSFILQITQPITRKVDAGALDSMGSAFADDEEEQARVSGIIDKIIESKPSLSVSAWKHLSDEERLLFADVVTESTGTPSAKLVQPKRGVDS